MRRTALVTGANSGIGLAIASRLLSSEINVIAHAKCDTDNLVQIKDKRLTIVRADLSSTKDTTKLIKEISEKKIDILVNNAGTYTYRDDFLSANDIQIERLLRVNVLAPIFLIQAVLPEMINRSWGRIVNVSSISVLHGGSASTLDYTLSKAALESLTYSLSNSYSKHNILVNAIRAGVTDTKIHKLNPSKDLKERKKKIPLGRIAFPNEIAAVVDFLCSNESSFVTGVVIPVSGGE